MLACSVYMPHTWCVAPLALDVLAAEYPLDASVSKGQVRSRVVASRGGFPKAWLQGFPARNM